MNNIEELLNQTNSNLAVYSSILKTDNVLNRPQYKNIMCSISGGADSDILIDLCSKLDTDKKIKYVWFDTGLEYQATKDHLKYLTEKYDVAILQEKAIKPIPHTCKQYGQPFYLNRSVNI